MILEYITWNVDPEIIKLFGKLEIRWYGLLFALSFYLSYVIFVRFFKKEKLPTELLDKLTLYVIIGTIVGARLGHCLFYDPAYYLKHPIDILKVWEGGLASHGGAIGILIALYLFYRKTKRNMLWSLDRIVIVGALCAFLIRTGNLMNSEIYGVATESKFGFVFARSFTYYLDGEEEVKNVSFEKVQTDTLIKNKFVPLIMNIKFNKKVRSEDKISSFMRYEVYNRLNRDLSDSEENIFYPPDIDYDYKLTKDKRNFVAKLEVWGVPKYPTQIFEALSYLLIFFMLIYMYYRHNGKLFAGMLSGLFFMTLFTARFIIEIIKENQVPFEESLPLNMGQLLSIPFIFAGFVLFIYAIRTRRIL